MPRSRFGLRRNGTFSESDAVQFGGSAPRESSTSPVGFQSVVTMLPDLVENIGDVGLENSGVYFITCECFGAKFLKVGRSKSVDSRRRELQCGCPFELTIEHVQPMDEKEALELERRYRETFRSMQQRIRQGNASISTTDANLMPRWFSFTGEIEAFVRQLRTEATPDANLVREQQALLF